MRLSSLSTVPLSSVCLRSAVARRCQNPSLCLGPPGKFQATPVSAKERTVAGLTRAELAMIRRHLEPLPQDLSASLSPAIRAPAGNCSTCCRFCLPCWAGPGPGCNRPHAVAPPNTTTTRHSGLRAMLVGAADGVATLSSVGADAGRAGPRRSTGGRQLQQLGRCLGGGQDETAKVAVSGVSRSDVPTYTR